MAEETISDEDFNKYFQTYLSGKYHPLVEQYGQVLSQAMSRKGEVKEWRKEFDKLETNFDRVFFIMKALECFNEGEEGIRILGLPPTKETNKFLTNGKSDAIARKCLSVADKFYRDHSLVHALIALNRGYFSAVSKEVKYEILLKRIRLIKKFGADEVLEEEIANILQNKTTDENTQTVDSLRKDIEEIVDFHVCQGQWSCSHPDVPESLVGKASDNTTKMQKADKFKFVPSKDGILQSPGAGTECKYAMVASRDIPIGEVILSEKPYASVPNRSYSSLCYNCYRHCINIRPCQRCAYIGFCSEKCADDARNPISSLNGGPGRHVHDCDGIFPCLRLDDLFSDGSRTVQGLTHLVFMCIANTPANILLGDIYSSSINKKQGFTYTGSSVVIKPTDYSSIACRQPSIEMRPKHLIWNSTVVAVFLTYCLSITGYPMKWFGEAKEHFYSKPSSINQPGWLPASWIAARIVSHLLAIDSIAKRYTEYYEETKELFSKYNWIANCIYPTISSISHDCNPNACVVNTANGGAFLYALRSLKEGERISISYANYYFSVSSTKFRKMLLQNRFQINCFCEACRNDWCLSRRRDFEIIKCPFCESGFKSIRDKCSSCKKANGYLMFQKILHEKIPFLLNALKYDSGVGRESVSEAISLMDEVQRLISSPSATVAFVMSQGMHLIDRMFGIRFTLLT